MIENEYDIMISYARKRERVAKDIYEELKENHNYKIWIDLKLLRGGVDYTNEIYNAIRSSRIVLFVMSEESLNSKWCKDELKEAIADKIKVLPVLIDENLDPYAGDKLKSIDPILGRKDIFKAFPEYAKKIKEINDEIVNLLNNKGTILPDYSSELIDESIVGRSKEVEDIFTLIDSINDQKTKRPISKVNLYGMGGIGKSYVIKKFISTYFKVDRYRSIHMVKYVDSMESTIASIPFTNFDDDKYFNSIKSTKTKEKELYNKKIVMLKELGSHIILFIDGVDYVDINEILPLLKLPTIIIFVSRNKYEYDGIEGKIVPYEIKRMSEGDNTILFYSKATGLKHTKENNEKIRKIINAVDGHTFSISLLASQISPNELDIDDVLSIDNLYEWLKIKDEKGDISGIINRANLSNEELSTLKFFSFFNKGLSRGEIQRIDKMYLLPYLSKLARKGLVDYNCSIYQVHQIVRETMFNSYQINLDDIKYYMEKFIKSFRDVLTTKFKTFPVLESMIEHIKGNDFLAGLMYHHFAMAYSDFGYSELFHLSFEDYQSQDMEFSAFVNENNLNESFFIKSEKLERKAIEIFNNLPFEERFMLASSTSCLGSSYFNRNRFDEAFTYQLEALDYSRKYLDKSSNMHEIILDRIIKTGLITKNPNYEKIISAIDELEELSLKNESKYVNIASVYHQKGNVYQKLGDDDKAIEYYDKAIASNKDDLTKSYGHSELLLRKAEIFKKHNEFEKAQKCYLEAKEIRMKIINDKDTLNKFIEKYDKIYLTVSIL